MERLSPEERKEIRKKLDECLGVKIIQRIRLGKTRMGEIIQDQIRLLDHAKILEDELECVRLVVADYKKLRDWLDKTCPRIGGCLLARGLDSSCTTKPGVTRYQRP